MRQATGNRQPAAGVWGVARCLLPAALLLLAGCGKDISPEWQAIIASEPMAPPTPPGECREKGDPKWTVPPEGDELAADTARREQRNKTAFRELAGRRRVCAAGLEGREPK
ncbi:MAG: hypothetical protein AB7S70_00670 [Hyphomicrobium sp.]|uniref:hypothetical protein n=1 Tax=Hyphomicrobium sp. TaxID=82 RepID=UPI003D095BE3